MTVKKTYPKPERTKYVNAKEYQAALKKWQAMTDAMRSVGKNRRPTAAQRREYERMVTEMEAGRARARATTPKKPPSNFAQRGTVKTPNPNRVKDPSPPRGRGRVPTPEQVAEYNRMRKEVSADLARGRRATPKKPPAPKRSDFPTEDAWRKAKMSYQYTTGKGVKTGKKATPKQHAAYRKLVKDVHEDTGLAQLAKRQGKTRKQVEAEVKAAKAAYEAAERKQREALKAADRKDRQGTQRRPQTQEDIETARARLLASNKKAATAAKYKAYGKANKARNDAAKVKKAKAQAAAKAKYKAYGEANRKRNAAAKAKKSPYMGIPKPRQQQRAGRASGGFMSKAMSIAKPC